MPLVCVCVADQAFNLKTNSLLGIQIQRISNPFHSIHCEFTLRARHSNKIFTFRLRNDVELLDGRSIESRNRHSTQEVEKSASKRQISECDDAWNEPIANSTLNSFHFRCEMPTTVLLCIAVPFYPLDEMIWFCSQSIENECVWLLVCVSCVRFNGCIA